MQDRYKLRRHDRALTQEESWQFLKESAVGRLGLATTDGYPYVVPLNHVMCDNEIFFHCAAKGRKLDILRQNPQVCYEVDSLLGIKTGPKACDYSTYYKSVIAFGTAYEITDITKKAEVLNALTAKHVPPGHSFEPVAEANVTKITVIGIKVEALTGKSHPNSAIT